MDIDSIRKRIEDGDSMFRRQSITVLLGALDDEMGRAEKAEAELAKLEQSANDWILKNNTEWQGQIKSLPAFFQARLNQLDGESRAMLDAEARVAQLEEVLGHIGGLTLSYDGFGTVEGLESLIDDIAKVAKSGKVEWIKASQ